MIAFLIGAFFYTLLATGAGFFLVFLLAPFAMIGERSAYKIKNEFKVGDEVYIGKASGISLGNRFFANGDITRVTAVERGHIRIKAGEYQLVVTAHEYGCIKKLGGETL